MLRRHWIHDDRAVCPHSNQKNGVSVSKGFCVSRAAGVTGVTDTDAGIQYAQRPHG